MMRKTQHDPKKLILYTDGQYAGCTDADDGGGGGGDVDDDENGDGDHDDKLE